MHFVGTIVALTLLATAAAAQEHGTDASGATPAPTQSDPQAPAPLICNITVVGNTPLNTVEALPVGFFIAAMPICSLGMIIALCLRIAERWRGAK